MLPSTHPHQPVLPQAPARFAGAHAAVRAVLLLLRILKLSGHQRCLLQCCIMCAAELTCCAEVDAGPAAGLGPSCGWPCPHAPRVVPLLQAWPLGAAAAARAAATVLRQPCWQPTGTSVMLAGRTNNNTAHVCTQRCHLLVMRHLLGGRCHLGRHCGP